MTQKNSLAKVAELSNNVRKVAERRAQSLKLLEATDPERFAEVYEFERMAIPSLRLIGEALQRLGPRCRDSVDEVLFLASMAITPLAPDEVLIDEAGVHFPRKKKPLR